MNERIKELFKRAGGKSSGRNLASNPVQVVETHELWDDHIEKFAELIVRECIQTLRDNTPVVDEHDSVEDWDRGYIRGMVDCEHHIKEHFGVEE